MAKSVLMILPVRLSLDASEPRITARLWFTVLPPYGRHRIVQERQVEVLNVHEFEFGVGTLLWDFVNPFGHGLAVATESCTSNDDC